MSRKRPSFIELVPGLFRFLADEQGFAGPEVGGLEDGDTVPAIAYARYHRPDIMIEVLHVVGFMGEDFVQTRYRPASTDERSWISIGTNTTRTGYQLHRALDVQAKAVAETLTIWQS